MPHTFTANKTESEIRIPVAGESLSGTLSLPEPAHGIVLFAHGSGSSRFSPRNRFVAAALHEAGMATLLMDLLTDREERVDMTTAQWFTRYLGGTTDVNVR